MLGYIYFDYNDRKTWWAENVIRSLFKQIHNYQIGWKLTVTKWLKWVKSPDIATLKNQLLLAFAKVDWVLFLFDALYEISAACSKGISWCSFRLKWVFFSSLSIWTLFWTLPLCRGRSFVSLLKKEHILPLCVSVDKHNVKKLEVISNGFVRKVVCCINISLQAIRFVKDQVVGNAILAP